MQTAYALLKALAKLLLKRGVRESYGQFGEDAFIQSLVKHITNGVYVDVGAYHPTLYSNTYGLYTKGWRGVAIDPNHAMRPLFRVLRPHDTFVCAAIGEGGSGQYYRFNDGAYNTFDEAEAIKRKGLRWLKFLGASPVAFKPLAEILTEQKITHIDFLNIDVEGRDLQVLESHNWSIQPTVIAIEDDSFNPSQPTASPVYNFLSGKGYILAGFCGLTLVWKLGKNV